MRFSSVRAWAQAVSFSIALSFPALAQTAGSTEAAELFTQGRAALVAKDYPTACTKLAASLQLERAVGTLISLAECEEATKKFASARQHWGEAADFADASNDPLHRGPFARQKLAEVEPRVPRLRVRLAATAPPGTTVTQDGVELPAALLDAPFPVDPGHHVIIAIAPGRDARTFEVEITEGESISVEVGPAGVPSDGSDQAPRPPLLGPAARLDTTPEAPTGTDRGETQRLIGFAVGGAGIVELAVGVGFGLTANAKWSQAKADCGSGCGPTANAQAEKSEALSAATASTIFFATGVAAVLGGVVLLLTAPGSASGASASASGVRVAPMMAPAAGGLAVLGTF